MKFSILIISLFFFSFQGNSQYAGQPASNMAGAGAQNVNGAAISMLSSSLNKNRAKRFLSDEFVGSPYTNNSFTPGLVYYDDENQGKIYFRYNAYNEEVEIKQTELEEDPIKSLNTNKAIGIKLENGNYLSFKTFIDKNDNTLNGYLALLHSGSTYDLYKRTTVKFTEAQPAQNSFVKATPNRFTHFTEYYIQKKGVNKIEEIVLKNRKLVKMLDNPTKVKLKEYLKDNGLNIKNESHLIKAIQFINQV